MKQFTEQNLIFKVVYTISEYWPFPDILDKEIEWDGEQIVEQQLYAELNIHQFLGLLLENDLTECNRTLGIQIETGHLIPAVNFTDENDCKSCYVSVYTMELLDAALSASDEPTEQPVIGKGGVTMGKIAFSNAGEVWESMVECLHGIIYPEVYRYHHSTIKEDIANLIPKLIDGLNEIFQDFELR